jgi:hypothetical protein
VDQLERNTRCWPDLTRIQPLASCKPATHALPPSITRNSRRRSGTVSFGSVGAIATAASSSSPIDHTCLAMPSAMAGRRCLVSGVRGQRLMRTAPIVVRDVQAHGRRMAFQLLRKALVNRVNRRDSMRIVRLLRSTYDVEISSGAPCIAWRLTATTSAGE